MIWRPMRQTMLLHTFYGGHWTLLSSLRLRFPDIVPDHAQRDHCGAGAKGMYAFDPEQAQPWRQVGVVVTAVVLFGLQRFAGSGGIRLSLARHPYDRVGGGH